MWLGSFNYLYFFNYYQCQHIGISVVPGVHVGIGVSCPQLITDISCKKETCYIASVTCKEGQSLMITELQVTLID